MSRAKSLPWSEADQQLLAQRYPHQSTHELAALFQRPLGSVYTRAAALGLKKSAAYLASDKAGRILRGQVNERMVSGRFSAGKVPWNKGLHYIAGGNSALTQFKPGQRPNTWKPVGSYRVTCDGVLEQKTNSQPGPNHVRWKPVARLVWQAAHGPIPAGNLVVFKPGAKTCRLAEITADRLECITRKENAARNHPNNRSPELAKLCQLKGAITRQINRITKESHAS